MYSIESYQRAISKIAKIRDCGMEGSTSLLILVKYKTDAYVLHSLLCESGESAYSLASLSFTPFESNSKHSIEIRTIDSFAEALLQHPSGAKSFTVVDRFSSIEVDDFMAKRTQVVYATRVIAELISQLKIGRRYNLIESYYSAILFVGNATDTSHEDNALLSLLSATYVAT